FEDLFYWNEIYPGQQDSSGQYTPTGISIGYGSKVQSTQSDFRQGSGRQTGRQLDIMIKGKGFLQVLDPASGEIQYTRAGDLDVNANGQVVIGSASTGRLLEPAVTIPENATDITIGPDGIVSVKEPGNTELSQVGQIELAMFINPDGLLKLGENLYSQTDASGTAIQNTPGQEGAGTLIQNMLESSNVEPVNELIDLITTQRAFELNSKTIQTGDEVLQTVTNLKRF
ncbi:MAG: flagellar basal-body rod protein FlgG, partial [Planctomycetia bacterium]